jgi:hypothetical protein
MKIIAKLRRRHFLGFCDRLSGKILATAEKKR